MFVLELKLDNFRCHNTKKITFSSRLNIIYGDNATGKTSILEAIALLSVAKSFRTHNSHDMINENSNYFYICGLFKSNEKDFALSYYLDQERHYLKNGNNVIKRTSDFIGLSNVVAYTSDDLTLFDGSPSDRMILFDRVFCQISKDYLDACNLLNSIIKERNTLLKSLKFENKTNLVELMNVYDERFVRVAKTIICFRAKYINKLRDILQKKHSIISSQAEIADLVYQPNASDEDISKRLKERRNLDIERGYTSVGPKRDDCIFIINNKNTVKYGSQGQKKNILISLKLAFAELINEEKGEAPILILDDVFSYLDKKRQNALLNCLNKDYQTIITTSSLSDIDDEIINNAYLINLKEE